MLADEEPRNEVSDDCHIFKFAQSCRMLLIAKKSVVYLRTLRQIWCITYLKECQFYVSPKSCVLCSIVISSPKPKCKMHSTSLKQKKKNTCIVDNYLFISYFIVPAFFHFGLPDQICGILMICSELLKNLIYLMAFLFSDRAVQMMMNQRISTTTSVL